MSILIKGMEMPKSCLNCFLSRSGCRAVLKRMRAMERETWIPANYRHDDCPLVHVPPHGRLIDADDFFRSFPELLPYEFAAPTIIEAEEGER